MTGDRRSRADIERDALKAKWPAEFRDGARTGFLGKGDGNRDKGGYPAGFHEWPLERRNAWYAGFNHGILECVANENAAAADE